MTDELIIHALHRNTQSNQRNANTNDRMGKRDYESNHNSKNISNICKVCLRLGHCIIEGDICYILAKATVYHSFMASSANKEYIRQNQLDFKKEQKEKTYKAKTSSKMQGMNRKMVANGSILEELTAIINLAQDMEDNSDDGYDSSESVSSSDM